MNRTCTAIALVATILLISCARPKSSADYALALNAWTMLVGQLGDEAALDPRSDEVLAILARVPDNSLDAESAKDLRMRIESERKTQTEERARRQKLVAAAGVVPTMPAMTGSGSDQPQAIPAPRSPALVPGTKIEEFRETYGDCFGSKGSVELTSPNAPPRFGEMWVMNDDPKCREKHPSLTGKVALFSDGALVALTTESAAKKTTTRTEVTTDVEVQRLPDGGVGIRTADGGIRPIPPGSTLVMPDGGKP